MGELERVLECCFLSAKGGKERKRTVAAPPGPSIQTSPLPSHHTHPIPLHLKAFASWSPLLSPQQQHHCSVSTDLFPCDRPNHLTNTTHPIRQIQCRYWSPSHHHRQVPIKSSRHFPTPPPPSVLCFSVLRCPLQDKTRGDESRMVVGYSASQNEPKTSSLPLHSKGERMRMPPSREDRQLAAIHHQ